jgi:hypothetical protein
VRARTGWGKTRARAKEAHQNLVWWRAGDFLRNREVRDADGAPLELGVLGLDSDDPGIIHALPLRAKFYRFLG